jgi:hypothetical protein
MDSENIAGPVKLLYYRLQERKGAYLDISQMHSLLFSIGLDGDKLHIYRIK